MQWRLKTLCKCNSGQAAYVAQVMMLLRGEDILCKQRDDDEWMICCTCYSMRDAGSIVAEIENQNPLEIVVAPLYTATCPAI